MKKSGFAIILVLATLVLLAMLSLTYIKLALIDRNIARNYMDNKRAKLIAQSGVDYAIGRLNEIFTTTDGPFSNTDWIYDDSKVSFAARKADGTIQLVKINSKDISFTTIAGGTYGENSDIIITKVKDCQGLININDGLGNQRGTANLARIVNNLAKVIDASFDDLGDVIIWDKLLQKDKRPSGGYSNVSEIRRVLVGKYGVTGEDYYKKLEPFITCYAWKDNNVANPVPLSPSVIDDYPVKYNTGLNTAAGTVNVYRYGRGFDVNGNPIASDLKYAPLPYADPMSFDHGIYGLDELNPQWIELVSRSPVNINTASSEVLTALLKDLKGFFVSDRRRNMFGNAYYILNQSMTFKGNICNYSPGGAKDELGFLYATNQIDSTLAANISQEIINCRDKTAPYATQWFGGSFKTWRQFNAFVDSLVGDGKLLNDTRPDTFYEYNLSPTSPTYDQPVSSEVARRQASQAMADCLKANFNPNLHLNELNPDANILTLVDKTDLIVNSTEFCLTPMGYFQIESEGLILKEDKIIARSKIDTLVKLYDVTRHTNEKQFLDGILVEDKAGTNSGKALEIGPEPGHKLEEVIVGWKKVKGELVPIIDIKTVTIEFARENEWSGYIALATNGTDPGTQATFFCHYSTDYNTYFNANYHADGDSYKPNVTSNNIADKTESGVKGPYPYSLNNRLARSFRKESDVKPSTIPGQYAYQTSSDLRIDGAYVERHAGLAYRYNGTSSLVFKDPGMLCYWIKPSFYPETTGKPRTFFSLSKPDVDPFDPSINAPVFFANYYLGIHYTSTAYDGGLPKYNSRPFNNTSILFCYSTASTALYNDGAYGQLGDGAFANKTIALNHLSHFGGACYPTGTSPKPNYLRSGQWIHVGCFWKLPKTNEEISAYIANGTDPDPTKLSDLNCEVWIDGQLVSRPYGNVPNHPGVVALSSLIEPDPLSGSSIFRFGEPTDGANGDKIRNWTSDSTVDEFYIFSDGTTPLSNMVQEMYGRGRYYKLDTSSFNETSFISGTLSFPQQQSNTPSCSTITAPSTSGSGSSILMSSTKIIGLSWTYYGESVDVDGNPVIKNYKIFDPFDPSVDLAARVKISILKNYDPSTKTQEAEYGSFEEDSYTAMNLETDSMAQYRYKVTFKINNIDPANTVLLYSPVFDDITIYYTDGVKFLQYSYVD